MIHGPCGGTHTSSPCMAATGKCSKYFPKIYQDKTIVDQDGYLVYRRRPNGYTIEKSSMTMDNHHVVPYNAYLLLKFQAHINMEWCNQCTSIKYLFKYITRVMTGSQLLSLDHLKTRVLGMEKEMRLKSILIVVMFLPARLAGESSLFLSTLGNLQLRGCSIIWKGKIQFIIKIMNE
jgi:hypothetical protein